jgi:hypothetical protein
MSSDSSGVLALQTGANSTAMTLDASGNVGIGTTSPTALTSNKALTINSPTGFGSLLDLKTNETLNLRVFSNASSSGLSLKTATPLVFETNDTERMRIDSSGNVGIGTTSPSTLVDLAKSNTSGNDNQMPNLFVRNTSATQGNGSSTFNQSIVGVSAGNSTVSGGIRAAYDSAGSYGTGVQFYVNSTNPLQFYTNGSERMRITSSGTFGIGTTTGLNSKVTLYSDCNALTAMEMRDTGTTGGYLIAFYNSSSNLAGGIIHNGTTTVNYSTSSDYRMKENIAPMTGALSKVALLNPVTYKWKEEFGGESGQGFIAHELQAVVPEAVAGAKDALNEDGSIKPQGIDTSFLVATLTAAIQELKTIVDAQAAEIAELKAKVA